MRRHRRAISAALAGTVLAGSLAAAGVAVEVNDEPFQDLLPNSWYYAVVRECCDTGLMNGVSENEFDPDGMFSLAEALMLAARLRDMYYGGDGNIPTWGDPWYQDAVVYCMENGIIHAGDFKNYYTRDATRAEVAGIIEAALPEDEWTQLNDVKALPDVTSATPYCTAIFRLYNAGVLTGSDKYGLFQPYAYITRAEIATIALRAFDPDLRKILNLAPTSTKPVPKIPGGYFNKMTMSNGRLRFKNPVNGKYGYLDYDGNVIVTPVYDEVQDFLDGYAVVKTGEKWGAIDLIGRWAVPNSCDKITNLGNGCFNVYNYNTNYLVRPGAVLTTGGFSEFKKFSDGLFEANDQNDKNRHGLCNSHGGIVVPFQYSRIDSNGYFFFARKSDGYYDVYDINGSWCGYYEGIGYQENTRIFKVKQGKKWALADGSGPLTQFVYDDITLYKNASLALLQVGKARGLAGLNGEICDPFSPPFTNYDIVGDYACGYNGNKSTYCELFNSSGMICHLNTYPKTFYGIQTDKNNTVYAAFRDGIYDLTDVYAYDPLIPDAKYLVGGGIPAISYKNGVYQAADGFYGVYENEQKVNERNISCDLLTEAEFAGEYAVQDAANNFPSLWYYEIKNNSIGKPCVYRTNRISGESVPALQYFKNDINYDEIRDVGDGYFACRYNTDWYLATP